MNKHLILTTIGRRDCLPSWKSQNPNYDIWLVYYKPDIDYDYYVKKADRFFHVPTFKYPALYKVISENWSEISKYKYIWMPDDDILLKRGMINHLFNTAEQYNLQMAQPSIVAKNYTWPVTIHQRDSKLRYVSMIEIMCPMFSVDALEKCYPTFKESNSGWGLEGVWASKLNWPKKSFAVIDEVVIEHIHVLNEHNGQLYKKLRKETTYRDPREEMRELLKKHNTRIQFVEYSKIRND
jgi:hypothetical protein